VDQVRVRAERGEHARDVDGLTARGNGGLSRTIYPADFEAVEAHRALYGRRQADAKDHRCLYLSCAEFRRRETALLR